MTPDTFAVFKRFSDPVQAKELALFLEENGIDVQLVNNSPAIDLTFTGNTHQNEVELKIPQSDFNKAQKLLNKRAEEEIVVDEEHYLFEFTDEELYEVLLKSDEWNEYDVIQARKILQLRGHDVNDSLMRSLKNQRLQDLAKPEESQRTKIVVGYVLAFLGGFLGIFIGYFMWTQKKTLPNGTKVYTYIEKDRKHGKNIFIIGVIVFIIGFGFRIWMGE